jgi:medium-chain acyl-[acyl-carrier-protein] hydrolase
MWACISIGSRRAPVHDGIWHGWMPVNNPWIQRFRRQRVARARLSCFHHAGAAAYRLRPQTLPEHVDVCAVQLPDRANRLREPALRSINRNVGNLVVALAPMLDVPFAFFGHSFGAVVASETARAWVVRGRTSLQHLLVSGRRPPHVPDPAPPLHPLAVAKFVAEIDRRYGGIPTEVVAHADVMAMLLSGLRADIEALETYRPAAMVRLHCPISAFGGDRDPLTPREHLDARRGVTDAAFRVRVFPGDA